MNNDFGIIVFLISGFFVLFVTFMACGYLFQVIVSTWGVAIVWEIIIIVLFCLALAYVIWFMRQDWE